MSRLISPAFIAAFAIQLLCGCGNSEKTVKLSGQVLAQGKAITVKEGETLTVVADFKNSKGEAKSAIAAVKTDGSFSFGEGAAIVPPGSELILLFDFSAGEEDEDRRRFKRDLSGFSLKHQTSEQVEQHIEIDLAKGTVTPK